MDFFVVLERAGYRVARRRRCCNRIGHAHKLTKEDAMKWFSTTFEVRAHALVWRAAEGSRLTKRLLALAGHHPEQAAHLNAAAWGRC